MTAISTSSTRSTIEDYFAQELESEIRHEYQNGEIIPMTGGTPEHNEIAGALYAAIRAALKGQSYRPFMSDQRLWIPDAQIYTYPDVMVLSTPIQRQPGRKDTVINPVVIAEILSPSTQNYDRGDKFVAYRSIPTLQDYLLIDQNQPHVEHYVKQATDQWLLTDHEDLTQQIHLSSLQISLSLTELYENIEFSDPENQNQES